MRIIATSLLILMTVTYFVFKRYEDYNLFFSFVTAFAEAAMVGALADWFAVVAIFRHPLGIPWIPHTAIIQKNKDRIGESIASFVVSNFFSDEVIKSKLETIRFSDTIISHFKENKKSLSAKAAEYIPDVMEPLLDRSSLPEIIHFQLKDKLKNVNVSPLADFLLSSLVSSQMHIPLVKKLLEDINKWACDNKENTIKIIEGMNRAFALPIVGDIIYRFIVKGLSKLIEDIENDAPTGFNNEILHNMPEKLANYVKTSQELQDKIEKLKIDILESEQFDKFVEEKISDVMEAVLLYVNNSNEEVAHMVEGIFNYVADDLLNDASIRESMDSLINDSIIGLVRTYREEIAGIISTTVKEWPMEDMVDKLETQVGGDLQYIRINGTVIGGIAGLIIHMITLLI
jgi:uncharacterized membrane-anchored protein YjiN (DUF445 family)